MQLTRPGEILLARKDAIKQAELLAQNVFQNNSLYFDEVNADDWTVSFKVPQSDYTTFSDPTDSEIKQMLNQVGGDGFYLNFYNSDNKMVAQWACGRTYVMGSPAPTYVIHKHLITFTYAADGSSTYTIVKNSDSGQVGVK